MKARTVSIIAAILCGLQQLVMAAAVLLVTLFAKTGGAGPWYGPFAKAAGAIACLALSLYFLRRTLRALGIGQPAPEQDLGLLPAASILAASALSWVAVTVEGSSWLDVLFIISHGDALRLFGYWKRVLVDGTLLLTFAVSCWLWWGTIVLAQASLQADRYVFAFFVALSPAVLVYADGIRTFWLVTLVLLLAGRRRLRSFAERLESLSLKTHAANAIAAALCGLQLLVMVSGVSRALTSSAWTVPWYLFVLEVPAGFALLAISLYFLRHTLRLLGIGEAPPPEDGGLLAIVNILAGLAVIAALALAAFMFVALLDSPTGPNWGLVNAIGLSIFTLCCWLWWGSIVLGQILLRADRHIVAFFVALSPPVLLYAGIRILFS